MSHGQNDEASEWLFSQMHDPSVSLRWRVECAKLLLEQGHRERSPIEVNIKVIIQGIDPQAQVTVSAQPMDPLPMGSLLSKLLLN